MVPVALPLLALLSQVAWVNTDSSLGAASGSRLYSAARVVDGLAHTWWCAGAADAGPGARIGMQLKTAARIDRVRIQVPQARPGLVPATEVRLATWGHAWDLELEPDGPTEAKLEPPLFGRVLSLRVMEPPRGRGPVPCIAEVELFEGSRRVVAEPLRGPLDPRAEPSIEGVWVRADEVDPTVFLALDRDGRWRLTGAPGAAAVTGGRWAYDVGASITFLGSGDNTAVPLRHGFGERSRPAIHLGAGPLAGLWYAFVPEFEAE